MRLIALLAGIGGGRSGSGRRCRAAVLSGRSGWCCWACGLRWPRGWRSIRPRRASGMGRTARRARAAALALTTAFALTM